MEKLFKDISLLTNGKFLFPYCNCLLIEDDITCLIDASPDPADWALIKDRPLDWIINSHGHIDHVWRNADFPHARIWLHPADNGLVESGENYLDTFGFNLFPEPLPGSRYLEAIGYRPRPADASITGGQLISTGQIEFEVLHLPGHTPGHCGFLFPREGFIFTSDITLDALGPWFGNRNSSVEDFIVSINRLIALGPEMLVPGHGRVYRQDIKRRLERYRDHLYNQSEKVIKYLRSGRNRIQDLAHERIVWRVLLQPAPLGIHYECMLLLKHLERLEKMGWVYREEDRWFAV